MSEQLLLDFTPPPAAARESSRVRAQSRKEEAYGLLRSVFRAAGRSGLTADEAICRAGLEWRYGRQRVSELLNDPEIRFLVAVPDAPRRTFTYPSGVTVQPAAVLAWANAYGDPTSRLLALQAAEQLTKQQRG